jgi:hypothetical protein
MPHIRGMTETAAAAPSPHVAGGSVGEPGGAA